MDEDDTSLSRSLGTEHSPPHMGMATGCLFDAPPPFLRRGERCFDVRIGVSGAARHTTTLRGCLKGVKQCLSYRVKCSPVLSRLRKTAAPGKALAVVSATLRIDGTDLATKPLTASDTLVSFTAPLGAGSYRLSPVFTTTQGDEVGANYCIVTPATAEE